MRVLPAGDTALLIEVASGVEAEALHAELLRRRAEGSLAVREIVPAARTVLLDGVADPARLASELTAAEVPPAPPRAREVIDIPVRYDGPDLAEVAALWGVPEEEVARIHAGTEFRVAFCGFAPGFGYLTGLPARYEVPRRATPRTAVPAGSVALAGPYTGVYPRSSPGGWQLIGTTDAVLWDHTRVPAALLTPGTRVRFVPVDRADRGGAPADGARAVPGRAVENAPEGRPRPGHTAVRASTDRAAQHTPGDCADGASADQARPGHTMAHASADRAARHTPGEPVYGASADRARPGETVARASTDRAGAA
jgi:KipI family sensor histidine kinase inhibitor